MNLKVWKDAKDIAIEIYKITKSSKDYSLKDQLRRASVSISSNIAEGDERFSNKESIKFFYIANGLNCRGYYSTHYCKRNRLY